MSRKEIDRREMNKELLQQEGAKQLRLSVRQVRRLVIRSLPAKESEREGW